MKEKLTQNLKKKNNIINSILKVRKEQLRWWGNNISLIWLGMKIKSKFTKMKTSLRWTSIHRWKTNKTSTIKLKKMSTTWCKIWIIGILTVLKVNVKTHQLTNMIKTYFQLKGSQLLQSHILLLLQWNRLTKIFSLGCYTNVLLFVGFSCHNLIHKAFKNFISLKRKQLKVSSIRTT